MEDNSGKFENMMKILKKYSLELFDITDRMEKDGVETQNEHLGKMANIIKILLGALENPYDLDEFMVYCEIFASRQILSRLDDEDNNNIREALVNYYKNNENNENNKK